MASSDRSRSSSGKSPEDQQPAKGRPPQIPKGSKRYRIDLGCSEQARIVYERWQKSLERYDTNASLVHQVLDVLEESNKLHAGKVL